MEFWHGKFMSYDQMTLLDLKKLCKDRGLKVSGKKDEVVIRLMEYDEAREFISRWQLNHFPHLYQQ